MDTENLKNIIRHHYSDLLEREPDELGLEYYLKLLSQKKLMNLN